MQPLTSPNSITLGIYENKLIKVLQTSGNYSIPTDWKFIIVYNLNNPYGNI